jgi:hypothetical protein
MLSNALCLFTILPFLLDYSKTSSSYSTPYLRVQRHLNWSYSSPAQCIVAQPQLQISKSRCTFSIGAAKLSNINRTLGKLRSTGSRGRAKTPRRRHTQLQVFCGRWATATSSMLCLGHLRLVHGPYAVF